jgi:hypothetical protein
VEAAYKTQFVELAFVLLDKCVLLVNAKHHVVALSVHRLSSAS